MTARFVDMNSKFEQQDMNSGHSGHLEDTSADQLGGNYHPCQHVQGDRLIHVCTLRGVLYTSMNLTIHGATGS